MQDANALYRAAARSADPSIQIAWGGLFLETFNLAEALKSFQQVLKESANWAPAHVGVARTLAAENPPAAAAAAEEALKIDPENADAQLMLAELDLDNTRYDAARERIDKVLKTNPAHLDARALLGAIAYVRGDTAAFEAETKRVLAINPAFGEVYRVAGDLAARHYRFDEAVALTRRAIELSPSNIRAQSDLGLHLMRTGDEAEARRVLDRAFKAFPFDQVTFNLLALLDKLEKFDVVQDGDLTFKFDPNETKVLREYAIPLAHEALKKLSANYQFTPKGPILIEVFPGPRRLRGPEPRPARAGRRARRVLRPCGQHGLAARQGAGRLLMAGDAVARARARRHAADVEPACAALADRRHFGLRGGPPRSRRGRTEMEVPFALALERGQVLKLRDLNSGFTKPDTIALAVLPGLAPRRSHRRDARRAGAARACCSPMATAPKVTTRSARGWASPSTTCRPRSTRCSTRASRASHGAA